MKNGKSFMFITYAIPDPVILTDGEKVENQSIINEFGVDNKLTLICSSVNESHCGFKWKVFSKLGIESITISNATLDVINQNEVFESHMSCISMSEKSVHADIFITNSKLMQITVRTEVMMSFLCTCIENPYYKLKSNQTLVVPLGSSPVISVIIAINSDGTRSQQDNVTKSLVFAHTNNSRAAANGDELEQDPVNFQLYHYTFPPVQNNSEGIYAITSGTDIMYCKF